jgi:diaminopimelate decarboxylase
LQTFNYKNNSLSIEQVSIDDLAKKVDTPFYCYSQTLIENAYDSYLDNLSSLDASICYAIKANSNQAIIKTLANKGCGADVVSEGELRRALAAGVPADKIVFSGVAKTETEMAYALSKDIFQFNVESENELHRLNQVAMRLNTKARIAFRINPDVDAKTHAKISTGKSENKFGIPISKALHIYKEANKLAGIEIQGIDVHIGSQLTCLKPFREAFAKIKAVVNSLNQIGIKIKVIDVGGGLGVEYQQDNDNISISDYCKMLEQEFADCACKIVLEPGRSMVANSGLLVSKVIYKKQGQQSIFLIIDAAMNDLLRPSMYDAHHEILPVKQCSEREVYDVVGPVCETGDTFARNREMSIVKEDQLVAIASAGAYGAVMSSTYNSRLQIPEVLVNQNTFHVIKPRGNYQSMIELDSLAPWQ